MPTYVPQVPCKTMKGTTSRQIRPLRTSRKSHPPRTIYLWTFVRKSKPSGPELMGTVIKLEVIFYEWKIFFKRKKTLRTKKKYIKCKDTRNLPIKTYEVNN